MKSLSLAKPLVLVTIGLPGAGKSFFARQFSETFSAPVVSGDRLRHLLKVQHPVSKDHQEMVDQLAVYQMEELLKTLKTLIVDGLVATRAERMAIRKLAKPKGYEVLLIWVQTDATTSQFRSMRRSKKREDDKYNQSLSADEFQRLSRRFHPPLANEPGVVISGKHTYATQARIVLKKLVGQRDTEIKPRTIVGHNNRSVREPGSGENMTPPKRDVLIR